MLNTKEKDDLKMDILFLYLVIFLLIYLFI